MAQADEIYAAGRGMRHDYHPALPLAAGTGQAAGKSGQDGLSFADLIDMVNPLQHIPFLSSLYRRVTGDEMGGAARIAGGALFGGVIGLVTSIADTVLDEITGADMGEHVLSAFNRPAGPQAPATALAAAAPYQGTVTVRPHAPHAPQGPSVPPAALDAATFNALAATLGSPELLSHLAPRDKQADDKPAAASFSLTLDSLTPDYEEALQRMRTGLELHAPIAPDKLPATP